MTLEQLLLAARRRLDDTRAPYLWSDDELTEFVNEAVDEACERARLIEDRTSTDATVVAVVAGENGFALHPSVWRVRAAFWETEDQPLMPCSKAELMSFPKDVPVVGDPVARPTAFYLDAFRMYLSPAPSVDGTVRLWVYRRPLEHMTSLGDEPEIPVSFHRDLVWWVSFLAYSRKDADTHDPDAASRAEAKFAARFGVRTSARVARAAMEMGTNTIYARRFGGA